ncbi:MAG: hypothetical protein U0R50_07145 [Gaiellales bacterium]
MLGEQVRTVVVERRYRGPLRSGNGGYVSGLLARELGGVVEVTLRQPPALERELGLFRTATGLELRDGETLVAEVRAGELEIEAPAAPAYEEAVAAPVVSAWWNSEAYGECFSCGTRPGGDGLEIHPRPFGDVVAAPWVAADVSPEVVWAAIDCSGAYAVGGPGRGEPLLARMTARIDRLPARDERCVVIGWSLGEDGRKLHAGTALYGGRGDLLALSRQLWIVPAAA